MNHNYIKRKASSIFKSNSNLDSDEPGPHSSDSYSEDSGSPTTTLPQSILAFRSITTLLSSLRKAGQMNLTHIDKASLDREVRQELRILVALATVLVRKHEVVTVVALHSDQPQQGERLQTIACTSSFNDDDDEQLKPSHMGNYRKDNDKSNGSLRARHRDTPPTVPRENLDVGEVDHSSLQQYVTWNAHTQTFDEHITIISKMINNSKVNPDGISVFQDYVIAACTSKILQRLKDRKFSRPFIDSLNAVSSFEFCSAYAAKRCPDKDLCVIIPELAELFLDKIPNLLQRCEATTADASYQLYTADTCTEFHWLLCELLKSFQEHLEKLHSSRDSTKESGFATRLAFVAVYGNALWSLARSGAIESHMKAIEPELLQMKTKDGEEDDEKDDEEQELDIELQSVQPFAYQDNERLPLWVSYRDWLRLMVVHLDAVAILHRHVSGRYFPYTGVSIKVVGPSPVTEALLPWENLLRSKHFPTSQSGVNSASGQPSNEDIVTFLKESLEKANLMKTFRKSFHALLKGDSLPKKHQLENIITKLNEFERDTDIVAIISMAESLKQISELSECRTVIDEITNMLGALTPDIGFFNVLNATVDGEGFKGVDHCEALLAVLITLGHTSASRTSLADWDVPVTIQNVGRVLGVSKPCCPVCHHLLEKLSNLPVSKPFQPFVTRGTHSTISACSLPTWLPEEIVHDMNMTFGSQLRQQLIQFMSDSKSMRNRAQSATSTRLSLDSLEDSRDLQRNDLRKLLDLMRRSK
ncbi:hypothetical protein AX17_005399 [Amanita inopinata Kibby_2008]|nr:hypothetical protein AX17_005399 [Amanita inopinata Kibby_2008]